MKSILLVCSAGMSTSLLVTKMNTAAVKTNVNVKIKAVPEVELKNNMDDADVILLGPQVRYLLNKIKSQAEPKGIKVEVINSMDYGTMNGENVLKYALNLMKDNN
ncbi:PTS sugar transporter subunit IIB [Clostridium lundense]|uniref:PTS sugar transporter subunit IIB n=1 Tax=Clostridium lundense TaxID=319475 RepID=UPI00047FAD31|nr:PTS sugar transporter subunit IIB [Clostridium lundense]